MGGSERVASDGWCQKYNKADTLKFSSEQFWINTLTKVIYFMSPQVSK